jgi:hypothetical protein
MVAHRVHGGERLVETEAVDIALEQVARAVIFGDLAAADGEIIRGRAVDGLRLAAALRVAGVGRSCARRTGAQQLVLGVVGVAEDAVAGEVAVAVVAERLGVNRRVLVEVVRRVGVASVGSPATRKLASLALTPLRW